MNVPFDVIFGSMGLIILIIGFLQKEMLRLRILNIIATMFYLLQALYLNNLILILSDLIVLAINLNEVRKMKEK